MGRYGRIENDDFLYDHLSVGVLTNSIYIDEYANGIAESLKALGVKTIVYNSYDNVADQDVIIVFGPYLFKDSIKKRKKGTLYIAVCLEQYPSRKLGFTKRGTTMLLNERSVIGDYDMVFCWTREQVKILSKWHKNVHYLPYAISHEYCVDVEAQSLDENEKSFDIFFVGDTSSSQRRKELLSFLSKKYNICPQTEDIWGDDKYTKMRKSRICLNLHQDWGRITEFPRLFEYAGNRCFILSEPMEESYPFIKGRDYDVFYWSNVCEKIDYYLENSEIRQRISKSAYETSQSINTLDVAEIILEEIFTELYYKKYSKNYLIRARDLLSSKIGFFESVKIVKNRLIILFKLKV